MERSLILRQLMIDRDMKVSDISKQSGIAYSTIKSIFEKGTEKASYVNICKICAALGITPDELECMVKENTIRDFQLSQRDLNMIEKYHSLDDPGRAHVDTVLDWEAERSGQLRQSQSENESLKLQLSQGQFLNRLLSYYGRIAAAGKSYGFEDMICGTIQVPLTDENRNADYAIGVSGNSMEPDFTGDDIVYVQKASHLGKGEIGIFQKDNCIYIKKVGDGELLSINQDYGPIPGEDVKVLGRVLGKIDGDYRIIK